MIISVANEHENGNESKKGSSCTSLQRKTTHETIRSAPSARESERSGHKSHRCLHDAREDGESEENWRFRQIVQIGYGREAATKVMSLVSSKADVNRRFAFDNADFAGSKIARKRFNKRYHGPAVVVAVMRGDMEILNALLQCNAHLTGPLSHYEMTAGLRKVKMAAPPLLAAASQGDIRLVRELLRRNAQVDEMATFDGKENTSVLWSACYHGSARVVKELLNHAELKASQGLLDKQEFLQRVASHQDDEKDIFTPLHIACQQGFVDVVNILLENRADVEPKLPLDGDMERLTPLLEAIDHERPDVVRVLVANKADILSQAAYEWLFLKKNNMVTISAAAEGLRWAVERHGDDAEEYISRNLVGENGERMLASFLSTPGDAKTHIVSVMFRQCILEKRGSKERRFFRHAHLANGKFNACLGPVSEFFPVTETTESHPRVLDFMGSLMPGRAFGARGLLPAWCRTRRVFSKDDSEGRVHSIPQMMVPVQVFQCVLRSVHTSPEVLIALAESENDSVFQEPGVQAIIKMGWVNIRRRYDLQFFLNLLFSVILLFVARDFNGESDKSFDTPERRRLHYASLVGRYLMIPLFLYGVWNEVKQVLGYCHMKKVTVYFADLNNYVDWFRFFITGFTVYIVVFNEDEMRESKYPNRPTLGRICLAFTVFFRWMKVLYSLRGYEGSGMSVLPVLRAVSQVWPFLFVVAFPLMGFIHAYYVFGVYDRDFVRAFTIIYRLGFVADLDLEEMEDIDPWYDHPANHETAVERFETGIEDPKFTDWRPFVVFITVVITLLITITMMNIFIAVLCDTYGNASSKRDEIFWRNRARIVLDETFKKQAEKDAWDSVASYLCRMRQPVESFLHMGSSDSIGAVSGVDGPWDYVWFCQPAQDARRVADGNTGFDEEDERAEEFTRLENMDHQIHDMRREMHLMFHDLRRDLLRFGTVAAETGEVTRGEAERRPRSAPPNRCRSGQLASPLHRSKAAPLGLLADRDALSQLLSERSPPVSPLPAWNRQPAGKRETTASLASEMEYRGNAVPDSSLAEQNDHPLKISSISGNLSPLRSTSGRLLDSLPNPSIRAPELSTNGVLPPVAHSTSLAPPPHVPEDKEKKG